MQLVLVSFSCVFGLLFACGVVCILVAVCSFGLWLCLL